MCCILRIDIFYKNFSHKTWIVVKLICSKLNFFTCLMWISSLWEIIKIKVSFCIWDQKRIIPCRFLPENITSFSLPYSLCCMSYINLGKRCFVELAKVGRINFLRSIGKASELSILEMTFFWNPTWNKIKLYLSPAFLPCYPRCL